MHTGVEAFINGARMARELASAEDNPVERARHIERADWYEDHAEMLEWRRECRENEMKEAAE